MTLGTVTLLVAAALLYHMLRRTDGPNAARFDDELIGENATKAPPEHQLLWFLGLIGAGMVVGFFLAIGLFLVTFLKVRTELPNRTIARSEEHTSELQSLMRTSYAVFCLKTKKSPNTPTK